MKYLSIVEILSNELDVPPDVVDAAYKSYYAFVREVISGLPLKEDLSESEFNNLRTNFNLPALGKLHCTYERYVAMKEQKKHIDNLRKKYGNKED